MRGSIFNHVKYSPETHRKEVRLEKQTFSFILITVLNPFLKGKKHTGSAWFFDSQVEYKYLTLLHPICMERCRGCKIFPSKEQPKNSFSSYQQKKAPRIDKRFPFLMRITHILPIPEMVAGRPCRRPVRPSQVPRKSARAFKLSSTSNSDEMWEGGGNSWGRRLCYATLNYFISFITGSSFLLNIYFRPRTGMAPGLLDETISIAARKRGPPHKRFPEPGKENGLLF